MMKKLKSLWKFLTKKDKLMHLIGGVVLQIVFTIIFSDVTAIGITLGIGLLWEVKDLIREKGTPEMADMLMTWFGALLVFMTTTLFI